MCWKPDWRKCIIGNRSVPAVIMLQWAATAHGQTRPSVPLPPLPSSSPSPSNSNSKKLYWHGEGTLTLPKLKTNITNGRYQTELQLLSLSLFTSLRLSVSTHLISPPFTFPRSLYPSRARGRDGVGRDLWWAGVCRQKSPPWKSGGWLPWCRSTRRG